MFPVHWGGVCEVSRCGYSSFLSQSIVDTLSQADLPYHRGRFIHSLVAVANIKKVVYFHRLHEVMSTRSQHGLGWHSTVLALLREITDDVELGQGVFATLTAWESPVVQAAREPDPVVDPVMNKEFATTRDVIKVCVYLPQLIWTPMVEMLVRWSNSLSKEDEEELGQVCSTSSATLTLEKCENKQLPYIELEFFTDSRLASETFLDHVRVAHTYITYISIGALGQGDPSSDLLAAADFVILVAGGSTDGQTDSSAAPAAVMRRIVRLGLTARVLLLLPHGEMSTMLRALTLIDRRERNNNNNNKNATTSSSSIAVSILPAAYVVR